MDKHSVFIRYIVCIICFFPVLWGCEKPSEPPLKSRQITKKIIVEKKDVQKETAQPKVAVPPDISDLKQELVAEKSPAAKNTIMPETTGKGYVVKNGTYIGTNSGKIVEILKDRIIIEEESEDIYGKVSIIKKPIKLQKPPGE